MRGDAPDRGSDPLKSALQRLPVPILTIDSEERLRPLNRAGVKLCDAEKLASDLLRLQPGHPLADLVRGVLAAEPGSVVSATLVEFPSGESYLVEVSDKSEKGRGRWLLLLLRKPEEKRNLEDLCNKWDLTAREREVLEHLVEGENSEAICGRLGITQNTLKAHLRSIFGKSGSRTRAELVSKLVH